MSSVTNIGINGFGRIGRQVLRASLSNPDTRVVHINDPFLDAEAAAQAIRFDSAAGRYAGTVEVKGRYTLVVDGRSIALSANGDPSQTPWSEHGVQYVIECSGVYTTLERASGHLAGGAQRVIVATLCPDAPLLVLGCNEEAYKPSQQVVCAGTSVAVALAPVLRALHGSVAAPTSTSGGVASCTYTVVTGAVGGRTTDTTTASVKDPRAARAALGAICPLPNSSTADIRSFQRALPRGLAGRVAGSTVRVPTNNASLIDVSLTLEAPTTLGRIAEILASVEAAAPTTTTTQPPPSSTAADGFSPQRSASPTSVDPSVAQSPTTAGSTTTKAKKAPFSGLVGVVRDPVVSIDMQGEKASSVLDIGASYAIPPAASVDGASGEPSPGSLNVESTSFKLTLWFDNERGYSQRLIDLVRFTSAAW